jgi:hypothetical protein
MKSIKIKLIESFLYFNIIYYLCVVPIKKLKMCLSKVSNSELLKELSNRGLLTRAKSNTEVLKNMDSEYQVILTFGEPTTQMRCRECHSIKDSSSFSFYQGRVDANGYLMRSNALCYDCKQKSNKQRKLVLDSANIPDKPKDGDTCPNCDRPWEGNWHRHHVEDKFISYLCGHCNMSLSDQRNKKAKQVKI